MSIFNAKSDNNGLQKRQGASARASLKNSYFYAAMRMAICILIGYIFGSTSSNNISEMSGLVGHIETKESTSFERSAISRGANNTKNFTTGASIIEEIIPTALLPTYAPNKLQFNVTRSMLRQSRPIVGNTQRLHSYLKKVRSKICTTVVFLGGSGEIIIVVISFFW